MFTIFNFILCVILLPFLDYLFWQARSRRLGIIVMHVTMLRRSIVLLPILGVAATAASVDSCPGYTLSNIASSAGSLTGDLSLAGDACNTYGEDLDNLRLLVEYQTGMV